MGIPRHVHATTRALGFIALGILLERVAGVPLDAVIEAEVLRPLGLADTVFLSGLDPERAAARSAGRSFVATRAARGEVLCGRVDDDNAWMMGGVAGHAGLFATADDVGRFAQAWLDALAGRSGWLAAEVAEAFLARDRTPGSGRALGWDTPSPAGSALGTRLGRGPRGAVGHLGFTGTSLWIDPARQLVVVLLTNRVHPSAANDKIRQLRPALHDAVVQSLGRQG